MNNVYDLLAVVQQAPKEIKATQDTILERLDALELFQPAGSAELSAEQRRFASKIENIGQVAYHLRRKVHGGSAKQVFAIAELTEQILLHVDERTILALQRISQFKAVVDGSKLLRRRLFQSSEMINVHKHRVRMNRLLLWRGDDPNKYHSVFNSLHPALARDGDKYKLVLHAGRKFPAHMASSAEPVSLLRLRRAKYNQCKGKTANEGAYISLQFEVRTTPASQAWASRGSMQFADPGEKEDEGSYESWQSMFFTQPPVLDVLWYAQGVTHWRDPANGNPMHRGTVPAGTSFGDLLAEGMRLGWGGLREAHVGPEDG